MTQWNTLTVSINSHSTPSPAKSSPPSIYDRDTRCNGSDRAQARLRQGAIRAWARTNKNEAIDHGRKPPMQNSEATDSPSACAEQEVAAPPTDRHETKTSSRTRSIVAPAPIAVRTDTSYDPRNQSSTSRHRSAEDDAPASARPRKRRELSDEKFNLHLRRREVGWLSKAGQPMIVSLIIEAQVRIRARSKANPKSCPSGQRVSPRSLF